MKSLIKLLRYIKPYWIAAVAAPVFMLVEVAMDLAQPQFVRRIIDVGIAQGEVGIVVATSMRMLLFAFAGMVGGVGSTVFAMYAAQQMGADVRGALFRKVQSLSFGNLDRLRIGSLVNRLTNDVVQIQELIAIGLRLVVRACFLLLGSVVMAVITSVQLSIIPGILLPLLGVVLFIVIRKAYPLFQRRQSSLDGVNTVLQENLAGVRVVKAFVRADHEKKRFSRVNNGLMNRSMSAMRVIALVMPLSILLINMGIVAVLWYGGINFKLGNLTIGGIVAFVNYLMRSQMAVRMTSRLLTQLSRAMASADRVEEVLTDRPDLCPPEHPVTPAERSGRITFQNVSFSYEAEHGDPVLKDISFQINPGETVAILGSTGSGKSSLINLIPRFYDVTSGRITLDGVDVREFDLKDLRSRVVVALQDSILFSGSIAVNLRYGRPDANQQEMEAAARDAQAHKFITTAPGGYESELEQRGVNLSGGQKQRLAIARALVARPEVLILDDCTSAVDVETEARIQEALERNSGGLTTVMVAQRISSVLTADRILVLDDGILAAEGTHRELMENSPIYREIYDSQLGDGGSEGV